MEVVAVVVLVSGIGFFSGCAALGGGVDVDGADAEADGTGVEVVVAVGRTGITISCRPPLLKRRGDISSIISIRVRPKRMAFARCCRLSWTVRSEPLALQPANSIRVHLSTPGDLPSRLSLFPAISNPMAWCRES